jgi:hypothetical protein
MKASSTAAFASFFSLPKRRCQVALSLFTDFEKMTTFKPQPEQEKTLSTMLDQLVAFCGDAITEENVLDVFGFTSREKVAALTKEELATFVDRFEAMFLRLLTFPIPLVAAIGGHALAGGAVIALACDHRVMKDGPFQIGLNEVELGLPFPRELRRIQLEGFLQSNSTSLESANWKRELNRLNMEKLAWNEAKPPGQSTVHFTEPKSLPTITEKVPINQAAYEKALAKCSNWENAPGCEHAIL